MGASKRVAELILKAYANDKKINTKTIFSMVRFGNVLGSSGSVIPRFLKEQIKNGGPITLTHENIYRYFMTIEEAANLVLQSSAIAESSDLFLLDMGKPVSILNLAKQMIILSGLKVKDKSNPKGDIEIKTIGLRNGEKLYEELLVEPDSTPTHHPLIYRAIEKNNPDESFWIKFNKLEKTLIARDEINSLKNLKELVPEWEKFLTHE